MKSSRKRGKLVEDQRSKRHLDKISNLPDELLVIILSYLPTIYAVRTSILSRRWRYLFTFLFTLTDCLTLNDACFKTPRRERKFKKSVSKVLKLHQMSPSIRKFSLVCRGTYNKSHLNAWVKHAAQKGVQELYYSVNEYELPDAFAMCKTLLKLKVIGYAYRLPKFSLSSGLPSLKILHLKQVRFDENHETERLLSKCEFLEELTLDNCELYAMGHVTISIGQLKVLRIKYSNVKNGILKIEAPNLAYLTYYNVVGVKIVPLWKKSCSLVEAKLQFSYPSDTYRSFEDDHDLLRDVAYKITELHLLSKLVQFLLMTLRDKRQVRVFPRLSRLHLPPFSYDSLKTMTSVLNKSPRLEVVVFEPSFRHCCNNFPVMSRSSESLKPFSCHVKVIEVHDFCGYDEGMLLLLGHLLKNARVLKKLIVRRGCYCDDIEEELPISKDLLMLPRASSDCCIILTHH